MAITDYQMSEIQRKAKAGIQMSAPTAEKQKLYNQYAKTPPKPTVAAWGGVVPKTSFKGDSGFTKQPTAGFKGDNGFSLNANNNQQQMQRDFGAQRQVMQAKQNVYQPTVNNVNPVNKQPSFQLYNPSTNSGRSEVDYYDEMKNKLMEQRQALAVQEMDKGFGIGKDFSKSTLAPIQKQYYEIEDYMLKKFGQFGGRGGEGNDHSFYGIDRDSLGMNSIDANGFRIHDTADEHREKQRLVEQGFSAQQANERVRGIDPKAIYSPTNQFNNNNSMFAYSPQNQLNNGGGEPMASISSMNAPMSANSGIPDYQMSEIIRKAQAGIPMDKPTPEKMAVYNSYRSNQPSTQGDQANFNLDSIYDPQKQAQISRFNAERDRALGLINQQKTEAKSQYVGARNQTDVVNAQNVNRLREMMAANGISGSGENVTASVALGSARQGALSGLNMQEQQQNNDFNRQIADASSQEKLNAVLADIEAQKAQAVMEELWRNKEFVYNAGRDSINDGRYTEENIYNRGQDTKQWEHQTGREAVEDGRYNKEWGYNVGRDAIADKRYLEELTHARKQEALANSRRGSSGGGGGSSYYGASAYAPATKLPSNPTKPRIMTEQQYIDALEEPNARKKGTARVIPGSTDYAKKMQKVMSDLYK